MRLLYIAGPFTAPTARGIHENVARAVFAARDVMHGCPGVYPVVPHALGAFAHGIGTPDYHYAGTMALMEACDGVLLVPGWMESEGARRERLRALELGKRLFHVSDRGALDAMLEWAQARREGRG